jgi:predicted TIM-barrel fold metal-dependent hydrolase
VMWASDFPHPDAEFPGALDEFLEHLGAADRAASLEQILWDTPAAFYRLTSRFAAP